MGAIKAEYRIYKHDPEALGGIGEMLVIVRDRCLIGVIDGHTIDYSRAPQKGDTIEFPCEPDDQGSSLKVKAEVVDITYEPNASQDLIAKEYAEAYLVRVKPAA